MESCLNLINPLFTPKPHIPFIQHGRRNLNFLHVGYPTGGCFKLRATTGNSVAEIERKLLEEDEMGSIKEWIGGGGRCRDYENNGIVELMECLEKEAIMGDDIGREPMDYNRRAHIFDKSSKIFQAIKEDSSLNDS